MQWYFILALIVIFFFLRNDRHKITKHKHADTPILQTDDVDIDQIIDEFKNQPIDVEHTEYNGKYQKRYLLTKNEWYEYRKLKQLAESKGLQVCPKVRLLDLIEPRRGDPKYKTLLYKIQAKHVDFVICDQSLYVKAIIELDDNSHDQTDRKERDEFVDTILKDVGYKIIRTRSITENTLSAIDIQSQIKATSTGPDRS